MRLTQQTRHELEELLRVAKSMGWHEVTFDVRTEQQRRVVVDNTEAVSGAL